MPESSPDDIAITNSRTGEADADADGDGDGDGEPIRPVSVRALHAHGRNRAQIIPDLVLDHLDDRPPFALPAGGDEGGDDRDALDGEAFITAFGQVLGVYTWDATSVPTVARIQAALARRAGWDCRRFRRRPRQTRLVGWHGGWTEEGVGIFAAEIWGVSKRGPDRPLGRASLVVRTPGRRRRLGGPRPGLLTAGQTPPGPGEDRGRSRGQPTRAATSAQPKPTVSATTERLGASTTTKKG
jgi:hypothetical protein